MTLPRLTRSSNRSFCHARSGNAGTNACDSWTIHPRLVASIAWESADGEVTGVNVWETPRAIAEFFMERVGPLVEAEGEPTSKPQRHGEPLAFYLRN